MVYEIEFKASIVNNREIHSQENSRVQLYPSDQ